LIETNALPLSYTAISTLNHTSRNFSSL